MASSLYQYVTQGDLITDRYTKVLLTIIALSLIWLGVKDTRLESVVSAQNQGWDAPFQEWDDDPLALGFPNPNLALPASGSAYVCTSRLYGGAAYASYGDSGALYLNFLANPTVGAVLSAPLESTLRVRPLALLMPTTFIGRPHS
jgi:hypothetical protein